MRRSSMHHGSAPQAVHLDKLLVAKGNFQRSVIRSRPGVKKIRQGGALPTRTPLPVCAVRIL